MSEENEKTSLMDKYIKLRLGGATYRVRLMTVLLFAAAAIILIAAILIMAIVTLSTRFISRVSPDRTMRVE